MPYSPRYTQNARAGSKSSAKGLEKIIIKSGLAVQDMSFKVNTLFYGKSEMSTANSTGRRMKNPLDMGIIPILDILSSVDACELVSYALDKLRAAAPGGSSFNPNDKPTDPFGIVKWTFQKAAFDVQTQIDGFYNEVDDITALGVSGGAKILNLITEIKNKFSTFTNAFSNQEDPERFASIDPDIVTLLEAFPQLRSVGNYVNDSLSFFDKFSDFRQLQNADIQKAVNTINKIRQYCVLIQSLNNPTAAVLALAQNAIASQLDGLLKNLDLTQLIPTLKRINESLKSLIAICNSINSIINFGRLIIRIFSTIIFVFKVISKFFKKNPAPTAYATLGITTTSSDALTQLQKTVTTIETRLSQVASLLNVVSLVLNTILPILNEVIEKINTLIANIERCENSSNVLPKDVIDSVKNTVSELQNKTNELQAFLDKKKQNDLTTSDSSQLGEFTIQIIEEQVVEESFGLRRRYGVALNNNGVVQVQSQPTFASDDNVIINEVKLLLQQKGLIKYVSPLYTDTELANINDAMSYLADNNINNNIGYVESDIDITQDANSFFGGLPGGRRFRKRAQEAMLRERQNLNQTLGRQ
jgi:hypothetical protein